MPIQVIKRDGRLEDFSLEKISRVLIAAGLDEVDAQKVSQQVATWASQQPQAPTTLQIKDQIIALVTPINPYVAGLYRWYEKTKDSSIVV